MAENNPELSGGLLEVGPPPIDQQPNAAPPLNRRALLGWGTVAFAAGAAAALAARVETPLLIAENLLDQTPVGPAVDMATEYNQQATEKRWPGSEATTTELKSNTPEHKRHAVTFVFGGLGTFDSSKEAEALMPALETWGRVVSVRYANNGVDLGAEQIAEHINRFIRDNPDTEITELNFYGESMGGIAMTQVLPLLDLRGTKAHVNRLVYDCTPVIETDVRNKAIYNVSRVRKLGIKNGGGLLGKYVVQAWNQLVSNPNKCFTEEQRAQIAWRVTTDSTPPSLSEVQAQTIVDSTVDGFAEGLAAVEYKSITYLTAENDAIVNDLTAIENLTQANDRAHGGTIKVGVATLGLVGHAGATTYPHVYNAALGPMAHGRPAQNVKPAIAAVSAHRDCRRF